MICFELLIALKLVNDGVFTKHWQPIKNMSGRQKKTKRISK